MAVDNREVEIRFALSEDEFSALREKLTSIAESKGSMQQKDIYFTPQHRNFMEPQFPFEWFSVRRRGDKTILNYKHWNPPNSAEHTHCDEFETEVSNAENAEKIFSAFNFKKLITVEKERETFIHDGGFELCLDKVKDLGHFVEIEARRLFGTPEETKQKLIEFAETLGLDFSRMEKRGGYAFLMMEKKRLI